MITQTHSTTATMVSNRFGIPHDLAVEIVAEIDEAIDSGMSVESLVDDLGCEYGHRLDEDTDLIVVVETVARSYGLTAHLY